MIKRCYQETDNKYRPSVADFWDRVFREVSYEEYVGTLAYEEPAEAVRNVLDHLPKSSRVLDVGCGGGRFLVMAHQLGFADLIGLDISETGLRRGKEALPDLHMVKGSASELPFADGSVDVVLMVGVVYEIEDPAAHYAVFSEVSRVLRPGGSFLFVNKSPNNPGEKLYTLLNRERSFEGQFFVWRVGKKDIGQWIRGTGLHVVRRTPANFGLAIFRFFNNVFVDEQVRAERRARIMTLNTYSKENYHYLANRDVTMFNRWGRALFRLRPFLKNIFYNAEIYELLKDSESVRGRSEP